MKRLLPVAVSVLTAAALLSGCGLHLGNLQNVDLPTLPADETPVIVTEAPEITPEPTAAEEEAVVESLPVEDTGVTVSVTNQLEEYYDPAENKWLILTFSYDSPRVSVEGNEDATQKLNEYIGLLEDTWYTGNDYGVGTAVGRDIMLEIATDFFTYISETGQTTLRVDMAADRSLNIKRADSQAVSYLFSDYIYAGRYDETTTRLAVNFDTATGEHLSFSDIAANDGSEAAILNLLNPNGGDDLTTALSTALENGQWYFSEEGFVVFLQPADAEALNSEESFAVSYDEAAGLMKESYIPQTEQAAGDVSIIALSDYQENTTDIVDRVVADDNGTDYLLQISGTVYNLKLSRVDYSNSVFYETGELWFRNSITDASVQLCTVIPEGMPNLMLSYMEDGTEHVCYVSESGQDGQPFLAENVQAIG